MLSKWTFLKMPAGPRQERAQIEDSIAAIGVPPAWMTIADGRVFPPVNRFTRRYLRSY
jgi:hypothetical protein